MSPRKVRLVIDVVRGMKVERALQQLSFIHKAAARPVQILIKSAMANAEHNFKLDPKTLTIAKITADGGPILYRFTPKAFGRATPIRKRTTHITVVLTSPDAPAPDAKKTAASEKKKGEKKSVAASKGKNAVRTVSRAKKAPADKK